MLVLEGEIRFRRARKISLPDPARSSGRREKCPAPSRCSPLAHARCVIVTPGSLEQMLVEGGVPVERIRLEPQALGYDPDTTRALAEKFGFDIIGPQLSLGRVARRSTPGKDFHRALHPEHVGVPPALGIICGLIGVVLLGIIRPAHRAEQERFERRPGCGSRMVGGSAPGSAFSSRTPPSARSPSSPPWRRLASPSTPRASRWG